MDEKTLQNLLDGLLGEEGLNIAHLLQRRKRQKELSLVKVNPFHDKEEEDLYEWLESFENAARANNWLNHHCVEILPEFLKDATKDWYNANWKDLNGWNNMEANVENKIEAAEGMKSQFLSYFIPEVKQNQWYHELMTMGQFADKKVKDYKHHFKKLLQKVNGSITNLIVPEIL